MAGSGLLQKHGAVKGYFQPFILKFRMNIMMTGIKRQRTQQNAQRGSCTGSSEPAWPGHVTVLFCVFFLLHRSRTRSKQNRSMPYKYVLVVVVL